MKNTHISLETFKIEVLKVVVVHVSSSFELQVDLVFQLRPPSLKTLLSPIDFAHTMR